MSSAPEQGNDDSKALFSRAYLRPRSPERDSPRFRTRLYAEFFALLDRDQRFEFWKLVQRELGVTIPSGGESFNYRYFFEKGELRDVLDGITLVTRVVAVGYDRAKGTRWLSFARRVLQEEGLGYVINSEGAVRHLVDEEFERARFSTIEGLGSSRFNAVRQAVDDAFKKLDREPFDVKGAVRSMFEAVETLCKVLGDHNDDLTERMVKQRVRPIATRVYGEMDSSAQSFGERTVEGLINWVNAGHRYRHGQKTEEPHDPPLELAVAFLSQGVAYVRFLIDLADRNG